MRRSERLSVGDHPRIDVHLPSGGIEVREGPPGSVEVTIDASDPDLVVVSQVGDAVSIRQESRWGFRPRSIRVFATVPPRAELELVSASGDIRITGSLGPTRVRSTSGSVELDAVARLELSTTSGDLRVRRVGGDCTVSTVSGAGSIESIEGSFTGSSVSGDLRVSYVGGDLRIGTTSGNIRVERCDGGDVTLKSISGDLSLGLPTGIRVDADLSTISGRASLPDSEARATGEARRPVRLAVRTVSGDVTIRRAEGPRPN
jgi:DUF4097 and DUF4098 domain-containing protein YvlB